MNKNINDEKLRLKIQETILNSEEVRFLQQKFSDDLNNYLKKEVERDKEINVEYFANIIYKKVLEQLDELQKNNLEDKSVKQEIINILNYVTKQEYKTLEIFQGIKKEKNQEYNLISNDFVDTSFMWNELQKSILIADEIILISPFIDYAAVNELIKSLKLRKSPNLLILKILTTTFDGRMTSLNLEALKQLFDAFKNSNNIKIEIKIEDARQVKNQRLHAKSFIFKLDTHFGVAYVGSGNFTNVGLNKGKEWNIKISEFREERIFNNLLKSFEDIWNDEDNLYLVTKHENQFDFLIRVQKEIKENHKLSHDIKQTLNYENPLILNHERENFKLKDYQIEAIEKINYEREQNLKNHLIVMATGTGKTILAASDFQQQLEKSNKKVHLLFVAERKEILDQALKTYRFILNDNSFGTLCYSSISYDIKNATDIFITFDSLSSDNNWNEILKKEIDYIVFDEAHHLGARTYQQIFNHFKLKQIDILGLTATPIREDGHDVKEFFNNKYTFELNLWDAINEDYLADFKYYMIKDEKVDFTGIDLREAIVVETKLQTEGRNKFIFDKYQEIVNNLDNQKAIVFCFSINHAQDVEKYLKEQNFKVKTLTSRNNSIERIEILNAFRNQELDFLCVVDILNEGIDIKDINNVLFLRPTESKTLFTQQMGRGLRKNADKILNIFDFVNNIDMAINKSFNPMEKLGILSNANISSLLIASTKPESFSDYVNQQLPGNSEFILVAKTSKDILEQLSGIKSKKSQQLLLLEASTIKTYEEYKTFFTNTGLEPEDIYALKGQNNHSLNKFVLSNNLKSNFNSKIMIQYAYLNNIYLIDEFIKIIDRKQLTNDHLIDNLFVVSFYSFLTSNKELVSFKEEYHINNLIEYLFSPIYENLLEEIKYFLTYRKDNEYQTLIYNKNNFKGTIFTWQQTKAFSFHADFLEDNIWNLKRSSGIEHLKLNETEISIYTDDKTAYVNSNKFDYNDQYFHKDNILFWNAPSGTNGWKQYKTNETRNKLWTKNRVIKCFHKDEKLIKKFGEKSGIWEFIGQVEEMQNNWETPNKEVYTFKLK